MSPCDESLSRRIDGASGSVTLWPVDLLKSMLGCLVCWISRWRRRRVAIRQLQALNDHYLADLGLDRSQLAAGVEAIVEARGRRS